MASLRITQVASGVHLVAGRGVNWALVLDPTGVTILDAGYPRDADAVLASVAAVGRRPEDVEAVLLTHAHLDHLGGVPAVVARTGARVVSSAEEARHARREYDSRISTPRFLAQAVRPRGLVWVARTLAAIGTGAGTRVSDVEVAPDDAPVDAPGALVAVPTPGHTPGHLAWLMPSTGVLFSGDALVTAHPLCRHDGPQRLPASFSHDQAGVTRAIASLRDVPADVLAPGHGSPLRAPLHTIVEEVLDRT